MGHQAQKNYPTLANNGRTWGTVEPLFVRGGPPNVVFVEWGCSAAFAASRSGLFAGDAFVEDDDAILVGVDAVARIAGVAADFNRNVDLPFGPLE